MAPDTASDRSKWLSVIVLCTAQVMMILDENIVNVALPSIQDDLGFTTENLIWTVNAYAVPFGGFLLLAGRLGDLLGRKPVILAGLGSFIAASLACGMSTSAEMLLISRFAQGLSGAVTAAGLLGIIALTFDDPVRRNKAIGAFSFASAGGGVLGLTVGGVVTDALGWHWIFFINVPIGIVVAIAAAWLVPHRRGIGWSAGADIPGAVLVTSGIMLTVYALIQTETSGWLASPVLITAALGVALLAAFAVRQYRTRSPLLPRRLLRSRNIVGANLILATVVAAMFGFMYLLVLYLQRVLDFSPLRSGLAFLPTPLIIAAMSMVVVPRLLRRHSSRRLILIGITVQICAFAYLAQVPVDGHYLTDVFPAMLLLGLGFGMAMPSIMNLGMSDAAESDSGAASGLFNTTMQFGGAVGLAVLGTITTGVARGLSTEGLAELAAITAGYRTGFAIAAGILLIGAVVAAVVLRTTPAAAPPAPEATRHPQPTLHS